MTPDKLVEELDRIVQGAGPLQHLGAADPQPHRHARHRHQEPGRRQGRRAPTSARSTASPREIERVVQERARRHLRLGRAPDRRALHRRRDRPRRRGALRPQHRRRAERRLGGDRRRQRRRDGRGPAALPDQRALSARAARLGRERLRELPDRDRARRADPARRRRGDRDHRRPADAARARTRGCRAGSTSTCAAATCSSAVREMQRAVAQGGQAAAGLLDLVVGPVRVSGARDGASCKIVVPCDAARSSSCCSTSRSGASTRRC